MQHVFPKIDHVLARMGKWKYFTTLDIFSGYHHIPLRKEDRDYFAYAVEEVGQVRPTRNLECFLDLKMHQHTFKKQWNKFYEK